MSSYPEINYDFANQEVIHCCFLANKVDCFQMAVVAVVAVVLVVAGNNVQVVAVDIAYQK